MKKILSVIALAMLAFTAVSLTSCSSSDDGSSSDTYDNTALVGTWSATYSVTFMGQTMGTEVYTYVFNSDGTFSYSDVEHSSDPSYSGLDTNIKYSGTYKYSPSKGILYLDYTYNNTPAHSEYYARVSGNQLLIEKGIVDEGEDLKLIKQ